jgi:hypothetical protein
MNPKQEKARTKIIALLGNGMNHTEIAKALGCSTKTVQRVAKSIKPAMAEIKDLLTEYQRLLRKCLPIEDRVELYEQIARKAKTNPFAAMRALERVDELDGILTAKDEIGRPQEDAREHRPIFQLPPDTKVQIRIVPEPQARNALDSAINITPEQSATKAKQIGEGQEAGKMKVLQKGQKQTQSEHSRNANVNGNQ